MISTMKKISFALFVFMLPAASFAQIDFSFGVKGGALITDYDVEPLEIQNLPDMDELVYEGYTQSVPVSFVAGVFTQIWLTETFTLQTEVNYARRSSKSEVTFMQTDAWGDVFPKSIEKVSTRNDLEIPVLLNVNIVTFLNGHKLFGNFGPAMAILLKDDSNSSTSFGTIEDPDAKKFIEQALENDYSTVNFALQAGVGYDMNQFHVEARYDHGLTDLSEDNFNIFSKSFQLTAGYKF